MSCPSIDIYEDFISPKELFLNNFQTLPAKQKKIFRYLQGLAKYREVFPAHQTIARESGCSRDTVIETLKKFNNFGWIGSRTRCYRSNLYFMDRDIIPLNTWDPNTFLIAERKEIMIPTMNPTVNPTMNPTVNPTLYNVSNESSLLSVRKTSTEPSNVQDIKSEKEHILHKMGITDPKDIFCLCRFKLHVLGKAYEDLTTRWYKSGPIHKLAAWITSRCKEYQPHYANNPIIY